MNELETLKAKVREYLSYKSLDGKKIRQPLRAELAELVKEQSDERA